MIDVILTGGTASCWPDMAGRAAPGRVDLLADAVQACADRKGLSVAVRAWAPPDALAPMIDSCEMNLESWRALTRCLAAAPSASRACLIVHGTDTMAYTASVLGLLQHRSAIPIVLTGAQIAPSAPESDLASNIELALDACAGAFGDLTGETVIAFSGEVFRGVRATKADSLRPCAFRSPACVALPTNATERSGPGRWRVLRPTVNHGPLALGSLSPRIAALCVTPGFDGEILRRLDADAVILSLYGAGSAPDASGLALHLEALAREGAVCVARSACSGGGLHWGRYASTGPLEGGALINGRDMTLEAVFAKLSIMLSLGADAPSVTSAFATNFAGEVTLWEDG